MKSKKIVFFITLLVAAFSLYNSSVIGNSIINALNLCVRELIPAIFFFLIFATFISKCNLLSDIPKFISFPLSKIFGIKESFIGYAILGLLCGYPSCAIAMGEIYKNGLCSKSEAENMIAIFSCPSVAFLVSAVGISFFGKASSGILLLVCFIITTVIISNIFKKIFPPENIEYNPANKKHNIADSFTASVKEASLIMLEICGFVVVFSVISELVTSLVNPPSTIRPFIYGIFEVTSGVFAIDEALGHRSLIYACMILAWSGISILAQIAGISYAYGLSAKKYLYAKILFTFISPIVLILLMFIVPDAVPVFSYTGMYINPSYNISALIILLIFTIKNIASGKAKFLIKY